MNKWQFGPLRLTGAAEVYGYHALSIETDKANVQVSASKTGWVTLHIKGRVRIIEESDNAKLD